MTTLKNYQHDLLTVINFKGEEKNMKKNRMVLFAILIVFVASGCSTIANKFGPEESVFGGDRVTSASANQMFNSKFEGFDDAQLIHLLNPINLQEDKDKPGETNPNPNPNPNIVNQLRTAFFYANKYEDGEAHRSQIQDRLIAASNQRCNIYTTYLKRLSTKNNAFFGTLTTVLGGAGAIVTGAHTARLLSGLAGISSGTRAELNQAIFESVATSVIVPAIQKQRAEILVEIQNKRVEPNKLGLTEYTIEGAIADAIRYHGACSMDAGISFAQKSIQSFDDVGVMKFTDIQSKLNVARGASASFTMGSAFLDSLVVVENVLNKLKAKLPDYQIKIDLLKQEQKAIPQKLFNELLTSSAETGVFTTRAKALDAKLKDLSFNFYSASDADKYFKFSLLDGQQKQAKEFSAELSKKEIELSKELQKFDK